MKSRTLLISVIIGLTLLPNLLSSMAMVQRAQHEALWKKGIGSLMLDLQWNGEGIGRIPVERAAQISPIFKAQLANKEFGSKSRYTINIDEQMCSREAVQAFVSLLNLQKSIMPPWMQVKLPNSAIPYISTPTIGQKNLILELICLADQFQVSYLQDSLADTLSQMLDCPDLYNQKHFPLPNNEFIDAVACKAVSKPILNTVFTQGISCGGDKNYPPNNVPSCFTPNGSHVVAIKDVVATKNGEEDGEVRIIDIATMNMSRRIGRSSIHSVRFSPNGQYVVLISDSSAHGMKTSDWSDIATINRWAYHIYEANFSPDNKKVITAEGSGGVVITDILSGSKVVIDHEGRAYSARFSSNGSRIITVSGPPGVQERHRVRIIDTASLQDIVTINGVGAHCSHNGNYVFVQSRDGLKIVDASTGSILNDIQGARLYELKEGYGDDCGSTYCVIGFWNRECYGNDTLKLVSVSDGRVFATLHQRFKNARAVDCSSDSKYFAVLWGTNKIEILDTLTKKVISTIRYNDEFDKYCDWRTRCDSGTWAVNFSPDNKYIAVVAGAYTVKVFEVSSGKLMEVVEHDALVQTANFSPDSKGIITVSRDGKVKTKKFIAEGLPAEEVLAKAILTRLVVRMGARPYPHMHCSLRLPTWKERALNWINTKIFRRKEILMGSWVLRAFASLPEDERKSMHALWPNILEAVLKKGNIPDTWDTWAASYFGNDSVPTSEETTVKRYDIYDSLLKSRT
ncbi:hypothetical protein KJZ61_03800 [Candidatus Dependentiae bacterium]|nr:hypothetical protein [Candidatus Dependentiae bacterium]